MFDAQNGAAEMQRPSTFAHLRGSQALERLLAEDDIKTVVDIGSGAGEHARVMREAGREVVTISMIPPADYIGDFMAWPSPKTDVDAIWACHVLEHQVDPGAFLRECFRRLRHDGILAVTVPPLKHAIVGGHVCLWNAGLLLYQLILAGFDCRNARLGTYGYNISVIVRRNETITMPLLHNDEGDIERLARFFPIPVSQGFDGQLPDIRWNDQVPDLSEPAKIPEHVAILGLGPSLANYLDVAKRIGGRHRLCDEVWGVNALGGVLQCDRIFHMDDVRIQEIRAAADPESNIAVMLHWMRKHPGPIYTSRVHDDYPGLVAFPLEEVINSVNVAYFNSTAAYAVAYAIHIGVKKISLFGYDFTYPNSHHAEKGKACVEFYLGMATAKGINICIADASTLMDACETPDERLYGYDTLAVTIEQTPEGTGRVKFEPRETLPTAAEIEKKYDHSKHPNALVAAE